MPSFLFVKWCHSILNLDMDWIIVFLWLWILVIKGPRFLLHAYAFRLALVSFSMSNILCLMWDPTEYSFQIYRVLVLARICVSWFLGPFSPCYNYMNHPILLISCTSVIFCTAHIVLLLSLWFRYQVLGLIFCHCWQHKIFPFNSRWFCLYFYKLMPRLV